MDATENKPAGSPHLRPGPSPGQPHQPPGCSLCPAPSCFADVLRCTSASCWRATALPGHPRRLGPRLCLQLNAGQAAERAGATLPGERRRLPTPACTPWAGHGQRRSKRVNVGQGRDRCRDAAGGRAGHGGQPVAGTQQGQWGRLTYLLCRQKGKERSVPSPLRGEGTRRARPALPLHKASQAAAGYLFIRGGERERPAGDLAFSGAFLPSQQRRRSAPASSVTPVLLH